MEHTVNPPYIGKYIKNEHPSVIGDDTILPYTLDIPNLLEAYASSAGNVQLRMLQELYSSTCTRKFLDGTLSGFEELGNAFWSEFPGMRDALKTAVPKERYFTEFCSMIDVLNLSQILPHDEALADGHQDFGWSAETTEDGDQGFEDGTDTKSADGDQGLGTGGASTAANGHRVLEAWAEAATITSLPIFQNIIAFAENRKKVQAAADKLGHSEEEKLGAPKYMDELYQARTRLLKSNWLDYRHLNAFVSAASSVIPNCSDAVNSFIYKTTSGDDSDFVN